MGDKRVIILIFLIGLIGWASAWADNSSLYQEVDGCNLINTSNATYVLTQNVSSNGTCFTIYEENITLDCNGFWINYSIDGISNDYGIYINSHSNLTLKNCNIVDGNWESENTTRHGIYIVGSSNNNKLLNNYFYVNNSYGIYISSALYNNLTNNVIFSNTSMGIRLLNAHNSFLMDNFVSTNSQYGIYFGSNNNILKNNYVETVGPAYYLTDSNNNTLENNIGISTESNTAIRLGITNSTIINNTGESDSGYGFSLSSCSNNVFINNTATSNSSTGINIGQSVNNTFYRTIAKNIVGYHAIVFFSSNNTIFRDCINVSGGTYDVDYNSGTINVNNTFINCSYDTSKESAGGSQSELIRKWYYQAYVNYTNGTEIAGANISAYNSTGQLQFSSLTNSSGWISIQELTEYVNIGGTRSYYNNYTINATLSGYETESNVFNFTVQQNKLDDWFSLEEELIVGENMCGILNSSNTVYTLTSNVSSQGTCFTIDGENITLDCDGYWINYSILGEEDTYGIYSVDYNNNITIKNCNIIDGNWTSSVFLREGIYLVGTENSTVTNNFVNASNGIGIHLDYSDFNNITNNTLSSYNAEGMALFYSDFNNVTNNKVDLYNSTYSLSLGISHNNILLNNNVTNYATTNGFAIYVESCSNNTLIDNLGTSYNNYNGIHVYNSPNTTLINNTGTSSTGAGISLSSSSDCFLINNTAISDSYRALSISSSLNTIIYFQTARTTGTSGTRTGIFLYGANNSVIKDCVNISGGTYDIGHNSGQPTINNTFINCSYNINKEYVSSTNELTRKWYYQAYVNYTNGTEVAGANISAYNSTGGLQFSALSDSLGDIERQEVIEYVNIGGTRSYYNDYIINANKSGTANDTNTFNFTATQNKLDDFFTLGIVGEDACGTLDETGQTYTLTSNVSSQGTCFTIAAQNITLDCNGSWINYSIGGGDGNYGVYTNQFNSTVKNCNIVDGNSSSPGYNRFGIFLNLNSNQESEIINNKIYSKDHSIYLLESKGNLLENNTCESSYSGIYLYSSSNNTLKNNFGKGLNSEGINIYSNSLNNTLINNTGESLTHSGIYVASQSNQTNLINNLGSSNSSSGIHIYNSFYNNFTNNTAISNYSYALYIVGSGYNNFIEQNAQGIYPGSAGVYIINSEKDIYFRDCVNISGYTDNFMVVGKVTLVNCSYNPYNDYFYYGLLTRKWYYQAYVNYTNGTEASGVDVSVYNSTDDMQFSALSDSFGLIERQEVTEYIRENNTWNYYNNYSINASLTGYSVDSNELNFSLVQNKIDDWFSLEDLIAPSYSSISHNTTTVGTAVEFSLNIDDSLSLDPNGQYIFSTNNSGEWVNDTAVNFSSTPSWANVSETLNSTVGMIVGYMWYFNDSVGNENSTSVYVLTTTAVPVGEEEEDDDDGGGGGGSSDEDETIILKPSYTQIQEGYETAVSEGYMIQFNFSDKGQYLMEVQDINRFTGNISFSVNGTTYYVDLNESVKINLDNDSYYDLEASVELITFYNSSRMTFKEIHQEIPLSEKPNVTENALNENSNETFSQENQDVVNDEQNKKTLYVVVISAIIISVLGISTVVFIRLKKHKKHKSKK